MQGKAAMSECPRRRTGLIVPGRDARPAPPASLAVAVAVAVLALTALAVPAGALTVRSEHPRLFVSPEALPVLRARFGPGGPGAALFGKFQAYIDGYVNRGDLSSSYADDYACAYLITENPAYARIAIAGAMTALRAGEQLNNEGRGPARCSNVVLVYDWCYDRMSAAQRDSVREAVYAAHLDWDGRGDYAWQPKDTQWHYLLGITGDFADPAKNAFTLAKLQASVDHLDGFFLPCCDALRSNGAIDGYSWQKLEFLYTFVDCLRLSTDYAGRGLNSTFLRAGPGYWLHRMRPDWLPLRTPGKYNPQMQPAAHLAFFASRYGDLASQWAANTLVAAMTKSDMAGNNGIKLILWYDPQLPYTLLSGLPLDYYDPEMGFYFTRSGWTMGSASRDILLSFFNPPDTEYSQARSQNHFTVSRGADNLLIDSGRYGRDDDDGYSAWYLNSVAHNTVLVIDPGERYPAHTNSYGHAHQMPNEGGQLRFDRTCGGAGNPWPMCTISGDPGVACRGSMDVDYEDPAVVRIDSDATASYGNGKVASVLRRFHYLRPDWILIQDRIVLAKPGLETHIVFHCVERPTANGPLQVIEGDLANGGVFRANGTDMVKIDQGSSSARIHFLPGSGGTSEIRLIGGASRTGQVWKQNVESSDTYSYVADPADQSYEFYLGGKNWVPGGRDETYLREHRNDPGPDVAGDWRIEDVITGAQGVIDRSYLVQITEKDAPLPIVQARPGANQLEIEGVVEGVPVLTLVVCPPGTECAEVVHYEPGRP